MTDEAPQPPPAFEPLPDVFEIPPEALDRWKALTTAQPLAIPFGKQQMDNLLISLRQSIMAQIALGDALNLLTMNEMPKAQIEFRRHQELSRYAYSNLNWFIQHVMMNAEPEEVDNG